MASTGTEHPERISEAICVACGMPLIELDPPNHMCRICNVKTRGLVLRAVAKRKENAGNNPKRKTFKIPTEVAKKIIAQRGFGG